MPPVGLQRAPVLAQQARSSLYSASACISLKTSSTGTIIGGSAMICRRPSTTLVSLPSACMLSRVCALASIASPALSRFALICDRNWPMACSMSRWAYQTFNKGCCAKPRIAVR